MDTAIQLESWEPWWATAPPHNLSVTTASLIMKDGASLEGKGVTPDEIALPTGDDLRIGRDPPMARAANLAGLELTPTTACSHFQPKPAPSPTPLPSPRE